MVGLLVGRDEVRTRLVEAIAVGRHVAVTGPAGIGKTFLVGDVIADQRERRHVDRLVPGPAAAGRHLLGLAPLGGPRDVQPGNLPAIVSWYLRRWARLERERHRPLLWIDDVRHLDDMSASVIRHALIAEIVQVVATHRTPAPVPADVEALFTEGALERHELRPLDDDACRSLANASAGRILADVQVDRIIELSAGFPLYVRDLANTLDHGGDPLDHAHEVIGRRLSVLDPGQRTTACQIAVSEPVDRRLVDQQHVDELIGVGIVRPIGEGRVMLDHPLYAAWLIGALGPAITSVFADLVERSALVPDAADAITCAQWHWGAELPLATELVERALREAFSRSDGQTARRLAAEIDGIEGRLRTGQAMVLCGDVEGGLDEIISVCDSNALDVAVEAGVWAARYGGVMLQQIGRAHAALDRIELHDLQPPLRRQLLIARLWLWLFSTGVDPERFPEILSLAGADAPSDVTTYELAASGAGLIYQVHGPSAAQPLLQRLTDIEAQVAIPVDDACRGHAVVGWSHVFAGRGNVGVDVLTAQFEVAIAADNETGVGLIGGSGAFAAALCGRHRLAAELLNRSNRMAGPDWFRQRQLAGVIEIGNRCLLGDDDIDVSHLDADRSRAADLEPALVGRARTLIGQRFCDTYDHQGLRHALDRLADGGKRSWIGAISTELVDLNYDPSLFRWLADVLAESDDDGIAGVAHDAMLARLERQAESLVDIAEDFERADLVAAATRAFADADRLDEEGFHRTRIRSGLVRCRMRWEGGPMWWISHVEELPTRHQADKAAQAAEHGAQHVAAESFTSKRTVENHLYRTCALLGVSGREELAGVLAPLERPTDWWFGRRH